MEWALSLIADSARPMPKRKFRKNDLGIEQWMAYRKGLRCRTMNGWRCEAHQRISKWWLICEWNDTKKSMQSMNQWINEWVNLWVDEPMNRCINESLIQWTNECELSRWTNESMKGWSSESRSQWINEPVNQLIHEVNESMNWRTHEFIWVQWINESMIQ